MTKLFLLIFPFQSLQEGQGFSLTSLWTSLLLVFISQTINFAFPPLHHNAPYTTGRLCGPRTALLIPHLWAFSGTGIFGDGRNFP
jgi:hypothetical protein